MGFSGPPMLPERLEKVRAFRQKSNIPIEVDGGVKDATILLAKEAGATRFVATSFISASINPKNAYEKLVSLIRR
jgi:ribulose-phosphate 3-epimerase